MFEVRIDGNPHAMPCGITWHIRLDGCAIVEGEPWEGGAVLLALRQKGGDL